MVGNQLQLHCGGKPVDRLALAEIPTPEKTDSYMPVPHLELVERIDGYARDLLRRDLARESFGIARKGDQMFALLTYANGMKKCQVCGATGKVDVFVQDAETGEVPEEPNRVNCPACNGTGWETPEMGVSIGIRNSYDKSMSIGVAMGGRVFICDNLVLSGEIKIIKKHTPQVWKAIEDMCISTLYKHQPVWNQLQDDVAKLKSREIEHIHGHELLGVLIGAKIMSPRQIPVAYREWDKPSLPDFAGRNLWSLYNSVNQALKTSSVDTILERHRRLHDTLITLH